MKGVSDLSEVYTAIAGTFTLTIIGTIGYLTLSKLSESHPIIEEKGVLRNFIRALDILQSSPEAIMVLGIFIIGLLATAFNSRQTSVQKRRTGRA